MQLILRMFENGTSFPIGLNLCLTYKDWCGPAGQGLSPLSHLWPFTQHCWWRARFCVPGGASLTIVALCVCVCVGIYCDSYIKVQYSTPFCRETSEAFSEVSLFFLKKKKKPPISPPAPLLKCIWSPFHPIQIFQNTESFAERWRCEQMFSDFSFLLLIAASPQDIQQGYLAKILFFVVLLFTNSP